MASSTVDCQLCELMAGEYRCLKVVVYALRINDSLRFEMFILEVLVCTLSGGDEPDSPGGCPGKSKSLDNR